jgi:hypothetical protein
LIWNLDISYILLVLFWVVVEIAPTLTLTLKSGISVKSASFFRPNKTNWLSQEHPGFEKNRKSAKIHIPQRARDLFSNRHFAENQNELNR